MPNLNRSHPGRELLIRKEIDYAQMKRKQLALTFVLITSVILWNGCKARGTSSANAPAPASANTSPASSSPSTAASSNANSTGAAQSSTHPTPAKKPNGVYEWREVEEKGVVTIITKVKTTMSFRDDGSYSRVSQLGTKTYHTDAGRYTIEEPDKLTLTIQVSNKNIQTPAITKTFKFSLSPDGEQLKLTNEKKSSTATYQRTATTPKAS
jgi:hypothetical protein